MKLLKCSACGKLEKWHRMLPLYAFNKNITPQSISELSEPIFCTICSQSNNSQAKLLAVGGSLKA